MKRKKLLRLIALVFATALIFGTLVSGDVFFASAQGTTIVDLKVNDVYNPIGIDSEKPRFSWIMKSSVTGQKQNAYQVYVAKDSGFNNIVWNSRKKNSDSSIDVIYAGSALEAYSVYYWKVIVWDVNGAQIESQTATFETSVQQGGFLDADWITTDTRAYPEGFDFTGANWIWNGLTNGRPIETGYLRLPFTTNTAKTVDSAFVAFAADDYGEVYFNGELITSIVNIGDAWQQGHAVYLSDLIRNGDNVIAAKIENKQFGDSGLLCKLLITYTDGTKQTIESDTSWHVNSTADSDFMKLDYDSTAWNRPQEAKAYGAGPWMSNVRMPSKASAPSHGIAGAPIFKKAFTLDKTVNNIARARIYATAAGLYELTLNGEKTGDEFLAPAFTQYDMNIMYQSYDVTKLIEQGENVITATLGGGWYMGQIGRIFYGEQPAFLGKIVITYKDGTRQIINSDTSWDYTIDGPIISNDMYVGETYDATRTSDKYTFRKASSKTAQELNIGKISSQIAGSVKIMEEKLPTGESEPTQGAYLFDFGQNFAGVLEITVKAPKGTRIKIRHGERLNVDDTSGDGPIGTLYTRSNRGAAATDYYICGGETETYRPTFTYHGFQYAEISGIDRADIISVKAKIIYSDMEETGTFSSSNQLVNKLYSNILWGQKSNFVSIPTDCPQRDERHGYTGDSQIFVGTSAYNMDVKTFFDQYIMSVNDGQYDNGAYPGIAPGDQHPSANDAGRGGWADGGIIIPYTIYARYGDSSAIEKYYDNMAEYIQYLLDDTDANHLRTSQPMYGDWLALDSTPVAVTDTAFCAYSCQLMSEMAAVIGKHADAAKYAQHAKAYKDAWNKFYMRADGRTTRDTQTSYVIGLAFDVIAKDKQVAAAQHLVNAIRRDGNKLMTGFVTTGYLLPILSKFGHDDVAFSLLEQESYPSWLYHVNLGATTIWERWNSYTIHEGYLNESMNSFNHFAFGTVGEWMYSDVLGIKCDPASPAFKHFVLQPHYGGTMKFAKGSYNSKYGEIKAEWKLNGYRFNYKCTVPANTSATVYIPVSDAQSFTVNGREVSVLNKAIDGVEYIGTQDGKAQFEVVSGSYNFSVNTLGDVNLDGRVNLVDIIKIRSHILGNPLDADALNRADLNSDTKADIVDIMLLREMLLEIK